MPDIEINAVMKKLFTRLRVFLLAIAERQLYVLSLRSFERHTITAFGVQDHFFCIFHLLYIFVFLSSHTPALGLFFRGDGRHLYPR